MLTVKTVDELHAPSQPENFFRRFFSAVAAVSVAN